MQVPPVIATVSIIIPVYNRSALLRRALQSVLRQSRAEWEVIVVDDASTDDSASIAVQCDDARIRTVCLTSNSGQCVARNQGAELAGAQWLLFLDSDDELAPDALRMIMQRIEGVPQDVARLFFGCRWDDGTVSPNPPFSGQRMDYEAFVRWAESMCGNPTEVLSVVRRSAYCEMPLPNRRTRESGHNFDFAKRFDTIGFPDIARLYHADAHNRITDHARNPAAIIDDAPGLAWMADELLRKHGATLVHLAPRRYREVLQLGALSHLLSGHRWQGLVLATRGWLRAPLSARAAGLLACAWMSPRTFARAKARWGSS